jgi:hypothetical protein
MEISGSSDSTNAAVGVAVQKQVLDQMRVQGADLNKLIASAAAPVGSVNSPSQGQFIDAHA